MHSSGHCATLFEEFCRSVERFGDNVFLRAPASATRDHAGSALQYSYSQTAAAVQELAATYTADDIGSGDRVAIAFDSRLDVYQHLLALNSLGASIVPLNSSASDAEIVYVIEHSDSKAVVSADSHYARLATLVPELPVRDETSARRVQSAAAMATGDRRSEAALLYTSGTTGSPKGCMLSNNYFLSLGSWYTGLGGLCTLGPADRLLTPLPPNHMNALATSFTAMMMCGGTVIQMDRFHPREWWQEVRDERPTVIHCLGVMVAMLLSLPEQSGDDFSGQVRFCFGPGSDPRHQGEFEQRFGIPLVEAWAMTETGAGGITIADREPRHVGQRCIGKAKSSMDYRIVDEKDVDVPAGDAGELLVRSKGEDPRAMFFSGYYKDEAATREAWRGGWFHTGDVIRQGEDGSLFFVDRRKNVIRRSGENIAAVEVEAVLLQHGDVANCAVCPVPDEIRGDEVFAFIISDAIGSESLARDIFDHGLSKLAYFKVPAFVVFVDSLPLTASQKVSRGKLKALALDALERHAAYDMRPYKKRSKG